MTVEDLRLSFEKAAEAWRFDPSKKEHAMPRDMQAFLVLHCLCPKPRRRMVEAAEHDAIYLGVSPEELAASEPSDEVIARLFDLGVRYDDSTDSLIMRV